MSKKTELRLQRELRMLTQDQVSEGTGLSPDLIWRAEKGGKVNESSLRLLAYFYGLSPDYFLVGKDNAKSTIDTMNLLLVFPEGFDVTDWERDFCGRRFIHFAKDTVDSLIEFRQLKVGK